MQIKSSFSNYKVEPHLGEAQLIDLVILPFSLKENRCWHYDCFTQAEYKSSSIIFPLP
jgi:hypothetical protein